MRVFVSGVAGFLGSHLADASLADRHEVVGCDNLTGGYQHGPLRRAGDDPLYRGYDAQTPGSLRHWQAEPRVLPAEPGGHPWDGVRDCGSP